MSIKAVSWRDLGGFGERRRRTKRNSGAGMMRVEIKKVIGLRADEVVRRGRPAAGNANRLGKSI